MRRWATIAALALTLQLTGTDGNQNSTDSEAAGPTPAPAQGRLLASMSRTGVFELESEARGTEDTDPIDDDDDDDSADDGDDAPTDGMFYRGMGMAQQQQQQIDTQGGDSKPNVHNDGVNLYPYTQELRDYIVQAHNWARGSLVPSQAANMRQLRWDESLAIEAAELVNTCVFKHETENYAYSQNLMYGGYSLDRATVDGWMDGWVQNELSPYDRSGTGYLDLDHASAVLWAKSYLVGCASKMCPNGYLTACNYFTQGNWQGEQAYIPGPSCSQCPSQAPYCDATGKLCTADLTGATPPSKPNQSPVQTAAPTSTARAPAATPAKTAPSHAANATPAPTPQATIPHELCD